MTGSRLKTDIFLSFLFIVILFAPSLVKILPDKRAEVLNENRKLASLPSVDWNIRNIIQFPKEFEAFFNDHFYFRNIFITYYSLLKLKILKTSPQKDVVLGNNGWLYYAGDGAMLDYCSLQPFTPIELERCRIILEEKQSWLAKQGIAYLFIVSPNKHSIYPEFIPKEFHHGEGTRLDQLVNYLKKNSDIKILDLRKTLLKAKNKYRLYHCTDTHWNDAGAYFAYRKILEEINRMLGRKNSKPKDLSDFEILSKKGKGGDLTVIAGLNNEMHEERIIFKPKFTRCAQKIKLPSYLDRSWILERKDLGPFAMECPKAKGKMVVFHDSFTGALYPFLSEHFHKSVYIWLNYPDFDLMKQVVETEQPDIVVEELLERFLGYMRLEQEFPSPTWRELFDRSHKTLIHITPAFDASRFKHLRRISISTSPDGFFLHCTGSRPHFELPSMQVPASLRSVVRIDISSSKDAFLQISFQNKKNKGFESSMSRMAALKKGRNQVYIGLANINLNGNLKLYPGLTSGDYILHDLEIRSISDG